MAYTFEQLRQLAISAGVSDAPEAAKLHVYGARTQAELMAAVAVAESDGNPNAHNKVPPDDSYGLWQINMRGKLGPDRRQKLGLTSNSQLFNPQTNARAMAMILKEQGIDAWTTTHGGRGSKAAKILDDRDGPDNIDIGGVIGNVNPIDDIGSRIGNATNALTDTIGKALVNFGVVAVALVLIVLGVVILMGMGQAKRLTKLAGAAGGIAKVVK